MESLGAKLPISLTRESELLRTFAVDIALIAVSTRRCASSGDGRNNPSARKIAAKPGAARAASRGLVARMDM